MSDTTCSFVVPEPSANGGVHRLDAEHGTIHKDEPEKEDLTTQRAYFAMKADVLEVSAEEARYLSGMFETVADVLEDYHDEQQPITGDTA